jgi:hypothetical protein
MLVNLTYCTCIWFDIMFITILFIAFALWLKSIIYSLQKLYGSKERNLKNNQKLFESSQIFPHFVLLKSRQFKNHYWSCFSQALGLVYMYIFFHKCLYIHCISSSDNKSLDNVWSLFSCLKSKHFFLINYVPHLFLLTCVKFHGKKINNNYMLTHIYLPPFFQMASYDVT